MPSGQAAPFFTDCGFLSAAGGFISDMLSMSEKVLCFAFPLSELETMRNQHHSPLQGSCFMVKCLFIFTGRMFHKCSCNGVLADGTWPSCEMCGFSLEGKEPHGGQHEHRCRVSSPFVNDFPSATFPQRPWDTWKHTAVRPCRPPDSAIATVS